MHDSLAELRHETEFLISQILAVALSPEKAIGKVLQAIGENLGWELGKFWRIDAGQDKIFCEQVWRSPKAQAADEFSRDTKLAREVWENKKPSWIGSGASRDFCSAIAFPIALGETLFGVMEFFSTRPQAFDKNLLQTLDAIGGQVGQFLGRKAAEDCLQLAYDHMEQRVQERTVELVQSNAELQAEIKERKRAQKEILEVTQKEQRRFGSQLHDGLCQELAGILMFTKGVIQKMERKTRIDIAELKKISELLHEAIVQARDMARGLYPGELEATSLMHLLEELSASTQNHSGTACHFRCPDTILIGNNDTATHLYKIAQEAVSNAVRHGKATSIEVSLTRCQDDIVLKVEDDGVGFGEVPMTAKGIGLKIMKYRAQMIDAFFEVGPNTPRGVRLQCQLKANP